MSLILWFNEVGIKDISLVGGKNASLGEMLQKLTPKGINIPDGFAVTSEAYKYFIKFNNLEETIKKILSKLDKSNVDELKEIGKKIRNLILKGKMPDDLADLISKAYSKMEEKYGKNVDVAVRSSATAEDLPDASFAGQQETYLNIRGSKNVVKSVQKCFASLFTDRAISYRIDKGFDHFKVYLSAAVQKMVRSDKASSGVMFTLDTETGFREVVYITGAWGLGEYVVQGIVNPDEYYVFKPTLKKGYKAIISKKLGEKQQKLIYGKGPSNPTLGIKTTLSERQRFVLSDDEIIKLAKWAILIEDHYGKPMDIEWAKDGDGVDIGTGELFIVQARPETVHSTKQKDYYEVYQLKNMEKYYVQD